MLSQGTCLGFRPAPNEGVHETQPHTDVSFPLFLTPFPSKKNKIFFKKEQILTYRADFTKLILITW